LNFTFKKLGHEGVDWNQLAQYRVHWWAVVSMEMNLEFYKRRGIPSPPEWQLVKWTLLHGISCLCWCKTYVAL